MNRKINVTLEAGASIDGQAHAAGAVVETTLATALQLVEMGVIGRLPDIADPPVELGEDPALAAKARAMAETMVGHAVAQATTEVVAERDNALRRADELALQVAAITVQRDAVAGQLAAAQAAKKDTAPEGGEVTDSAEAKRRR